MSVIISISDLDDSASQLGVLQDQIYGFPSTSLQALYLCEEGNVSDPVTTLRDFSGNGRTATILTGAAAVSKKSNAVGTVDDDSGRGFLFKTPVAMGGGSFSVVAAFRYLGALAASTFPAIHQQSAAMTGENMANSNAQSPIAWNGQMLAAGAAIPNQLFAQPPFNNSVTTKSFSVASSDRFQWSVGAWSFDHITGTFTYRAGGAGGQTVDPTYTGAAVIAATGNHCFGMAAYQLGTNCDGDLGLAALYSGAKNAADLDALVTAAKARMLVRGIVCV